MKQKGAAAGAAAVLVLGLAAVLAAGRFRQGGEEPSVRDLFAMDTVMRFTAYGPDGEEAVDAAAEEIRRLDELLSAERETSEVYRLNREGKLAVSADTAAILAQANQIWADTDGCFDVTIYPLARLWGFAGGDYRVPGEEEIADALALVDGGSVTLEDGEAGLGEGQQIDLGGIAKGYASERAMECYRACGVTSGMVSLGGNIQVLGSKPDGAAWKIGIRSPWEDGEAVMASVEVTDCAVVTSGGYERYFEQDNHRYIHILDPANGYPSESDLASVTVISDDGMLADALSTALYVMGLERAVDYWKAREGFELVLADKAGKLYVTEKIAGSFQSDREYAVIER